MPGIRRLACVFIFLAAAGCAESSTAPSIPSIAFEPLDPATIPFASMGSGIVAFNRAEGTRLSRHIIDVNGRTASGYLLPQRDEEARISPDGKSFISLRSSAVGWDIYLTDSKGVATPLTFDGGKKNTPNWSYDGKRAFYIQTRICGPPVCAVGIGSDDVMQVTPATLTIGTFAPVLAKRPFQVRTFLESSTGTFLFATADTATDNPNSLQYPENQPPVMLFSIRGDGQQRRQLTAAAPAAVRTPVWSPDGKKFAFTRYEFGNRLILVANADGTNSTTILKDFNDWNPGNGSSLCWTGDGSRIMFIKTEGGTHIYSMRPDGTDVNQITFGSAVEDTNVSCSH